MSTVTRKKRAETGERKLRQPRPPLEEIKLAGGNPDGTAQVLLGRLHQLFRQMQGRSGLPPQPTPVQEMEPGERTPGGRSENYFIMGIAGAFVWYLLSWKATGNPSHETEMNRFLGFVMDELRKEVRTGVMGGEQGTNAPHSGMHWAAVLLLRFVACTYGFDELRWLTGAWLGGMLSACLLCADETLHAELPGFRIAPTALPVCPVRDAVLRASTGEPQDLPRKNRRGSDPVEEDRFWLGAWIAIELARRGWLPAPSPHNLPVLEHSMTIGTWAGGYLAILKTQPGMRGTGELVSWVLLENGRYTYGRGLAEPPALPEAAIVRKTPPRPPGRRRRARRAGALLGLSLAALLSAPRADAVELRGSIGPGGYTPPPNVSVVWRRPGEPDIVKPLNAAVPWVDDTTFRLRYGAGDPVTIGRQITAIQAEQNGLRAWLILKELYAQAGLLRVPPSIGQEVWDFAISEVGDHPPDWCDFVRFTNKEDPICHAACPPCTRSRQRGDPIPSGTSVPSPASVTLTGSVLSWTWQGEAQGAERDRIVTFSIYERRPGSAELFQLASAVKGVANGTPEAFRVSLALVQKGSQILLYAAMRKRHTAEVLVHGFDQSKPEEPPPPPPPPPRETCAEAIVRILLETAVQLEPALCSREVGP